MEVEGSEVAGLGAGGLGEVAKVEAGVGGLVEVGLGVAERRGEGDSVDSVEMGLVEEDLEVERVDLEA